MKKLIVLVSFLAAVFILVQCEKDPFVSQIEESNSEATPYYLKVPQGFPDYFLKQENALTE